MERTGWILSRRLKLKGDMAHCVLGKPIWNHVGRGKAGRAGRALLRSRDKERAFELLERRGGSEGGCRAVCRTSQHGAGTNRTEHPFMSPL